MRNEATIEFAGTSVDLESVRARAARLLDPLIFCSLLALIPLTAIPYGTFQTWWVAAFVCGAFALTALWIIEGLFGGAWRVSGLRLLLPAVALTLFAFIQTLPLGGAAGGAAGLLRGEVWQALSADPYATRLFALELLALTLAGALLLRYTSSPRRLRALVYAVIGVGVGSALFGIVRQTTQGDAPSFVLSLLAPAQGYGQFVNRNHFAYLMEMTLGLVLGLIVGGGVGRDRLLIYLAAALPMWAALVMSTSRGGILSMICQLVFLALFFSVAPFRKTSSRHGGRSRLLRFAGSLPVRAALAACLIVVIVVSVMWVGGDPLAQRVETVEREFGVESETVRSNTTRGDMWSAGWLLVKDNPLLGVGFGGFPAAFPRYHDASGEFRALRAMNDYLDLLAGGGAVALALALWFVGAFVSRARQRLRSCDPFRRAACLGALTGLLGVACHSFVDYGLQMTANALVFVFLVVIATADGRVENEPHPSAFEFSPTGDKRFRSSLP